MKSLAKTVQQLAPPPRQAIREALAARRSGFTDTIIVLDDDPTGIQTVHSVPVYTTWDKAAMRAVFEGPSQMAFILTNSRSFTQAQTARAHEEIARNIADAAQGRPHLVISRGDSTLRGHYPLETQVLADTLAAQTGHPMDGEIIMPFFPEGGRLTVDGTHYVATGDTMTPVGETEFARDQTFGYSSSRLSEWIEEKTRGLYSGADVTYVSIQALRACQWEEIEAQLMRAQNFGKVVVDAMDYADAESFAIPLLMAMRKGKRFLFRTAAAFTKVIGGIEDRPQLTPEELTDGGGAGGLVVVGSHVSKTTAQLQRLQSLGGIERVTFDQHLALSPERLAQEVRRVTAMCDANIRAGKTTVVATRRERLDIATGDKEDALRVAVVISDALAAVISGLHARPGFLLAKGGITSSDIGVKGLGVKRAMVQGQARPGIPVWKTGADSKFPGLSFIIFPGNVGTDDDLLDIVAALTAPSLCHAQRDAARAGNADVPAEM